MGSCLPYFFRAFFGGFERHTGRLRDAVEHGKRIRSFKPGKQISDKIIFDLRELRIGYCTVAHAAHLIENRAEHFNHSVVFNACVDTEITMISKLLVRGSHIIPRAHLVSYP